MELYTLTKQQLFKKLSSKPEGLSSTEAEKRLSEQGKNRLKEEKKKSNEKYKLFGITVISLLILYV